MITFFIKSTLCLFVLYGFYHIFLRNQKVLLFNRFYLIFSLIFSLVIPLIVITINAELPLYNALDRFTVYSKYLIQKKTVMEPASTLFNFQNLLVVFLIVISSILLIRFAMNIIRIIRKIVSNQKVQYENTKLVLIHDKTLPYSFFNYIFVNQPDFENGKIEKDLLIHEEAHCLQYHSIDVIFIEVLNVFLWFNPAIWLYRKAILLNHEYYADNKVLMTRDLIDYQHILLNIILQSNPDSLVSNFEYAFIKKRLNMMTKSIPQHYAILRKISAISVFLFIAITLTFSQEIKKTGYNKYSENNWWYPILKSHNIEPHAYNGFSNVFEMGSTNFVDNKIVTLENAFFLIKDSDRYTIIKTPLAYHDIDKNIIKGDKDVTIEVYKYSDDNKPIITAASTGFIYYLKKNTFTVN
jgi:hypothetical protein